MTGVLGLIGTILHREQVTISREMVAKRRRESNRVTGTVWSRARGGHQPAGRRESGFK